MEKSLEAYEKEYINKYNDLVFNSIWRHYFRRPREGGMLILLSCKAIKKGRKIANSIVANKIIPKVKSKAYDEKFALTANEEIEKATERFFIESEAKIYKLPVTYRVKGRTVLNSFIYNAINDGYIFQLELIYKMFADDVKKDN